MERNYDEVIAELLIEIDQIQRRGIDQDSRNEKFDKRLDLTIRRMVKVENRLEKIEKRLDASERRMELFDKKLERSIEHQENFIRMQSKLNQYFLTEIKKKNGKG